MPDTGFDQSFLEQEEVTIMGIGENDWLAQEYKREGRVITSEAARRLAKEHLLDCDSRGIQQEHHEDCAADELKRASRKSVSMEGKPTWQPAGKGREVYKKKTSLVDILLRVLFRFK